MNTLEDLQLALPVHPVTGLAALAVLDSGRIVWPVLGAAPDDDDNDNDGDGDGGQDGDGNAEDQDEDGADGNAGDGDGQGDDQDDDDDDRPLGPKGQKALEAEKAKRRREAARRRSAEAEVARLRNGGEDEAAKTRREADEAATAKANARIVRSEIKVAAAGKMANPKLALRLLDPAQFDVDEDGEVDEDAIADAIDELIKENPGLAAQGGKRFQGTGDGGARPRSQKKARPKSLGEAVARTMQK